MLSIVIPHYNSTKHLEKLLDSITYSRDIEIIVIDDKSNQDLTNLYELIERNKYKNLLFIKNKTNKKGAGVCRNIGLKKANGKWLLFADADDYFVEGFYSIVKNYFKTDYDVVYFRPSSIDLLTGESSDRHINVERLIRNHLNKNNAETETLLKYGFISPCSKLIKKSVLLNNNIYFEKILVANDVLFSTYLGYYMTKYHVSDEVIYCITESRGTLTSVISKKNYYTRLRARINCYNFLKSKLSKSELNVLNIYGRNLFTSAFKYKLSLREILQVYFELRRNGIKIFEMKLLNPVFILKKIIEIYKRHKKKNKFYVYEIDN